MCFYTWLEGECILNMHMKENVCLSYGMFLAGLGSVFEEMSLDMDFKSS